MEVNGHDAKGVAHAVVVEWVCKAPRRLTMKVMGVSEVEAARLRRIEESAMEEAESKRAKVCEVK